VDVAKVHPRYKKVVRRSSRFHAHDEENQAKAGDLVRSSRRARSLGSSAGAYREIVEAAK
jgi:small subunit ribosomal protein S17